MSHKHNTGNLEHGHYYASGHEEESEKRTLIVVVITSVMMVVEVACGIIYNSMALLADGWHMFTHAGALGIAVLAYYFSRREAKNKNFTFGTGKINALGGFSSAVILAIVAILVAWDSAARLYNPKPINYSDAIIVAVIGLFVNVVSAKILEVQHEEHHHDHNLKAAYIHVITDALTSVFAIFALLAGKYWDWAWLDPLMGILGGIIIFIWSWGLIRKTSIVLVDYVENHDLENHLRQAIEKDSDNKVTDLHLWQVSSGKVSAIISLVTDYPKQPQYYKDLLKDFHNVVHITVEVNKCQS